MLEREDDARMHTGYSISSLDWVAGEIERTRNVKRAEKLLKEQKIRKQNASLKQCRRIREKKIKITFHK